MMLRRWAVRKQFVGNVPSGRLIHSYGPMVLKCKTQIIEYSTT